MAATKFRGSALSVAWSFPNMKTIKTEDIPADAKAREFLDSVDLSQGEVVLLQNGQARMVLVSAKMLEQRRRAQAQFFALIDRLHQRHGGLDSDEVLSELEELDHLGPSHS